MTFANGDRRLIDVGLRQCDIRRGVQINETELGFLATVAAWHTQGSR